jgi:ferredoxin
MGSDDKARPKMNPIPVPLQAACKEACDQCPQAAIEIEE